MPRGGQGREGLAVRRGLCEPELFRLFGLMLASPYCQVSAVSVESRPECKAGESSHFPPPLGAQTTLRGVDRTRGHILARALVGDLAVGVETRRGI